MPLGCKVRVLDTMHSSGLLLIRTNMGYKLKSQDSMKNLELWMVTTRDPMSSAL